MQKIGDLILEVTQYPAIENTAPILLDVGAVFLDAYRSFLTDDYDGFESGNSHPILKRPEAVM